MKKKSVILEYFIDILASVFTPLLVITSDNLVLINISIISLSYKMCEITSSN